MNGRDERAEPMNGRDEPSVEEPLKEVRLLTYNVWFAEHVALVDRVQGISDVVTDTDPHVICMQEAGGGGAAGSRRHNYAPPQLVRFNPFTNQLKAATYFPLGQALSRAR